MRVALAQKVQPRRYALGAAAAMAALDLTTLISAKPVAGWLRPVWQPAEPEPAEVEAVLELIEAGRDRLKRWLESGFENLERIFQAE
jgi:hypothetical protein